jgi:hypothetical protein
MSKGAKGQFRLKKTEKTESVWAEAWTSIRKRVDGANETEWKKRWDAARARSESVSTGGKTLKGVKAVLSKLSYDDLTEAIAHAQSLLVEKKKERVEAIKAEAASMEAKAAELKKAAADLAKN